MNCIFSACYSSNRNYLYFRGMRSIWLSILTLFAAQAVFSQVCINNRYRERVFSQVNKTANIHYATVQSLPTVYLNETQTVTQNLYLDVWQPAGDTLQKRPLVILAFGGAFLIGTKNDADIQAACDSLAHLGYVTASIQYRLGLNPLVAASGERAVYRAAQDYSAAVRYFKQFANQYNIDTSAIFVGGCSAGSFAALHMAYGEDDERPASTFASGGLFPAPDLGCFDCSGNTYPFSHRVRGVINMWGAIGFTSWIEPNDPPIVSFHGTLDPVVPYNEGFPFTAGATLPFVYGSAKILERTQQLGIHHEFYSYPSALHQLWGAGLEETWVAGPTEFQVPILNGIRDFLFGQLKPLPTSLSGPENACSGEQFWYQVPLRSGFSYCWQVQNGQILQQNNNQLLVKWNFPGNGVVKVMEISPNQIPTDTFLVKNITINPTPQIQITGMQTICAGDTATLNISGGSDTYVFTPSGNVTQTAPGQFQLWPTQTTSYTIIGQTQSGCSAQSAWNITVNPSPVAPIITRQNDILFVPQQYSTYQWYLDGLPITGANSNTVAIIGNGTYSVLVGNNQNCAVFSFPYNVQNLSVEDYNQEVPAIFPNPSEGLFTLTGLTIGAFNLQILDMTGKTVYQKSYVISDLSPLHVSVNLPGGVYVLHISKVNGEKTNLRLIIAK